MVEEGKSPPRNMIDDYFFSPLFFNIVLENENAEFFSALL